MDIRNDLLHGLRGVLRLYERNCMPVCAQYGMTRCELEVLGFLSNHKELDTARDITEYRMLPKANVSQAVEALIGKGMLERTQDASDRRLIHLSLTQTAQEPVEALRQARQQFGEELTAGFTVEELEQYCALLARMAHNAREQLEQGRDPGKAVKSSGDAPNHPSR